MSADNKVNADAIANDEYKREKIEVVECDNYFKENGFLRDDTPYTNSKYYLNDDDDDDDENNLRISKSKNMLYAPIFLDTSLPRNGWIQGCVLCNAKTSNTNYYRDDIYNDFGYMIFCCHFCKRAKNKNKDIEMEYNDIVINYIDMYREDIHRAINGSNTPTSK